MTYRNNATTLVACALLLSLTSCFRHYYNTKALPAVKEPEIALLQEKGRSVYIHFDDRPMLATNLSRNDGMLEGTLTALPDDKEPDPVVKHTIGMHREHKSAMKNVEAQIHVFTRKVHSPANEALVLPLVDIKEIQYQRYNTGMSVLSHVAGFAAIITSIALTAGFIVATSGGLFDTISLNGLGL